MSAAVFRHKEMTNRYCIRFTLILAAFFVLSACSNPDPIRYVASDITGAGYANDFQLTDYNGKIRRLADFRGKIVAVFFGYTHCPDVCPTTLSDFALAMKRLGKDAEKVQVIFVTLDPERDTPALLAQYIPAFHPDFLGMYTTPTATAKLAKDFKIFYQKQPADIKGQYTVDHSAGTFIYDMQGRVRLYMAYGQGPEAIANDIKRLLHNPD